MKYFLNSKNQLFAFEADGSQDAFITDDMRPATDAEVAAIQNPAPTTAQLWATYQVEAQAALDKSDTTLMRCYENSVPLPQAWVDYRKALRAIVSAKTGDASQALPVRPPFPPGT